MDVTGANGPIITSSWDDGHPADLRVAELLAKFGVAGTFFVPIRNSERRPTLDKSDLRALHQGFEIGSHTLDHMDLTTLPEMEADRQIIVGKMELEDKLGERVSGFCYPRGSHTRAVRDVVRKSGFTYARTIENLCISPGEDLFTLPTTVQFFPHRASVYLKNYIRNGHLISRSLALAAILYSPNLTDRIKRTVDLCAERRAYFHLWGHSWEIEENNLWSELHASLAHIASLCCPSFTNREIAAKIVRTTHE